MANESTGNKAKCNVAIIVARRRRLPDYIENGHSIYSIMKSRNGRHIIGCRMYIGLYMHVYLVVIKSKQWQFS